MDSRFAAWRSPGARVVTVEAQTESVRLARKSAVHNQLSDRMDIREGDFRDPTKTNSHFQFVGDGQMFVMVCQSLVD